MLGGGLVATLCGCGRPAPAYLLSSTAPQDGGPVLTIPFDFYREFIFVKVSVNDNGPRWFLLDSGASNCEISLRTARELGLPLGRFRAVAGDGVGEGTTEESAVKGIVLRIGNTQIYRGKVAIIDMGPPEENLKHSVDGILGAPLFEPYVVQIDYTKHLVRIFDPRKYELLGKRDVVPILVKGHLPYIRASIFKSDGSSIVARLLVDTGADAPLSLNHPFSLKNALLPAQAASNVATGVGGTSPNVFGHLPRLQIGKTGFPDIPAFFSLATKGMKASDKYDGTVGNYLLVQFLVTFDYTHNQLILQKTQ